MGPSMGLELAGGRRYLTEECDPKTVDGRKKIEPRQLRMRSVGSGAPSH